MTKLETRNEYDSYKCSGVKWLGSIPTHWNVKKVKFATDINTRSLPETTPRKKKISYVDIGSVTFENGIESTESYIFSDAPTRARRLAKSGDIALSTVRTYLKAITHINGKFSDCVFSTGFAILSPKKFIYSRYLTYLLKSNAFTNQVDDVAKGMSYPAINSTELSNLFVLVPPLSEQVKIADYLDKKVTQIDEAITVKEKQINLLRERKKIITEEAITKGLKEHEPTINSGIDWIGEIPEHWEVKRAKYLLNEVDERSENGDEELLSVSHLTGVTPRAEKNVSMFMAEDYSGSKLCRDGDLVINIMWAWMGALGVSDRTGIVSPSYGVFRQQRDKTFHPIYLEYLLKSTKYVEYYNKVSTGLHSSRLRFYGHMLMAMKLGFPPYEEQCEIIKFLYKECLKMDKAIDALEQQLLNLKEYRSSLINSAVTGKIKVPGVV